MAKPIIWLGSEAALEVLMNFEAKYKFDVPANTVTAYDDYTDRPEYDAQFGVRSDRIGLTVLEKVGETTVLKVHGSLTPTFARWHTWYKGMVTSYEAIKDALAIVMESGETKVLMDFASGGGAVRGLDTVTTAMERAKKSGISLHGHTDSSSFSASYWLMAGCNEATASRMAEVGSIGTLMVLATYANTEETMGVTFTVIKEGEFKAIGNPYETLSDKDKAYLQKNLKETNNFFLEHVAVNRSLAMDDTSRWAEGQTFYAAKAVKLGLIDRVTTLDDLLASGASANTTGERRSFEMPISAEKLAQIEAGADPKSVLTKAELKQYEAGIEAAKVEPVVEAVVEEPVVEAVVELPVVVADTGTDALHKALKDNGKLEAKVETLTAENEKLQAAADSARAESDSLLVLAQAAVEKLQVATGSPRETKATATEVLAQYTGLQGKLATMFPTSQKSLAAPVEDNTQASQDYRHKTIQQNAKR